MPADTPAAVPGRIGALDVLRGIALLGMLLVHFNLYAVEEATPSRLSAWYGQGVTLFFEERFWAMFGILFGAGFAVLLERVEARGQPFVQIYLRRMAALAGYGIIAHAIFGYNVLLGYAAWGVPLLLVRRWSVRALTIALVLSASSWSVYALTTTGVRVAQAGEAAYLAGRGNRIASNRAFHDQNQKEREASDFRTVLLGRLRHMRWFYAQPFSFLPVNTLTLFLLGMIGFRLRLFDRPAEHRRLIAGLMAFGVVSWLAGHLIPSPGGPSPERSLLASMALGWATTGFGLVREMWLAFTYIGIVLLLVAHNPVWLQRLAIFGWPGRTALTSYMVQIAVLDLTMSNYGLGLKWTRMTLLAAGLALFVVNALVSRWWLTRMQFGPLEWVWRSITYWRLQPWRAGWPSNSIG